MSQSSQKLTPAVKTGRGGTRGVQGGVQSKSPGHRVMPLCTLKDQDTPGKPQFYIFQSQINYHG